MIYRRNGRFGYFNIITGKDVIPSSRHNFDYVWDFDDESGLAAVLENGKIGFIGNDGSYQISPQYPYIRLIPMKQILNSAMDTAFCLPKTKIHSD